MRKRTAKPAVPNDLRKMKTPQLDELLDTRRDEAARLVMDGRASRDLTVRNQAIAELETVVADVKRLEAEQERRDRRVSFDRNARSSLGPLSDRIAAHEERHSRKAQAQAERERDLAAKRQREAATRRAEKVKAGLIWEPPGGWDADGADALAAVFGASLLFDYLDRRGLDGRGQDPILHMPHLVFLHTALGLIAENGGEEATFDIGRMPRLPEGFSGDRNRILEHLVVNQLLDVERVGPKVTIRHGTLVRQLRDSFQEQWAERARPAKRPSIAEEAAGWLAETKTRLLGQGEPT